MIQNSATLPPLPNIDISSPEAARKSLAEYRYWESKNYHGFTADLLQCVPYVRCCIDMMRFPNAHKSEAMKQGAQEAIDKLKAMLAATEMHGR